VTGRAKKRKVKGSADTTFQGTAIRMPWRVGSISCSVGLMVIHVGKTKNRLDVR